MQRGLGDAIAAGLAGLADRARGWALRVWHRGGSGEGEADAEHGETGKGKLHF